MRAHQVLAAGQWDPTRETDQVLADFDLRHRRRITLTTRSGAMLLLDLAEARHLRDGDGLQTETGAVVRVLARPEPLLELTAADATDLARLAWHLGNRHLPVQMLPGALRIRNDHVIGAMVAALGGTVREVTAPFDPETGAYASGGLHHHPHD